MRYLQLYENFDEIKNACQHFGISDYIINSDGSINVDGSNVYLSNISHSKLPLKFKYVSNNFNCVKSELITLEGCPEKVGGDFVCSHNKLTTLIGGPKIVGNDYFCAFNNLENMYGFPDQVKGSLFPGSNPVYEIIQLIKFESNLNVDQKKFIKWLNEYEVIKGNKIFEEGLRQAYYMVTKKELWFELEFKNYTLI